MVQCEICGRQFGHPMQLGLHMDREHYASPSIDQGPEKDAMFTMSEPMDLAWRLRKGDLIIVSEAVAKKLCPEGKAAAKRKFKVYPSAYANGWAVQYCKGKFRKKKGKKK